MLARFAFRDYRGTTTERGSGELVSGKLF